MSNHGYRAACLGPVVDVQLASDIYLSERPAYRRVRQGLAEFETHGDQTSIKIGVIYSYAKQSSDHRHSRRDI